MTKNTAFLKLKTLIFMAPHHFLAVQPEGTPLMFQEETSKQYLVPAYYNITSLYPFVLKSLIDAETQYTSIKWELLAIAYVCERFITYLYSYPFIVDTDYKSLAIIALKCNLLQPLFAENALLSTKI